MFVTRGHDILDNNSCDYLQGDKFSDSFLILYHVLFLLNERNFIKKLSNKPFTFTLAILYVFVNRIFNPYLLISCWSGVMLSNF